MNFFAASPPPAGGAAASPAKTSLFGKAFNVIKNAAAMAIDPDNYEGDGQESEASEKDEAEDISNMTMDFRTKYDVGKSVNNQFDCIEPPSLVSFAATGAAADLELPSTEDELALEQELEMALKLDDPASGDASAPGDDKSAAGFVSHCAGQSFQTRVGPNYKANKQKAASAPALLELMSAE